VKGGNDMAVREITYEERDQMYDQAFKKMGIERKRPSREELEQEISDYLSKRQPCSLATCGKDGWPRISVVDFVNEGLTLYIFSEGGDKFKNLKENNKVAVGIGTGSQTMKSRGINIWGIAEVFDDETSEFAHGLKVISPILKGMEEAAGGQIKMPKGIMRMIRITPTRMVYHHTSKGIKLEVWEAE
jgi:uncharacterized pyridoxamine 5'-phosphate oxidase family protein